MLIPQRRLTMFNQMFTGAHGRQLKIGLNGFVTVLLEYRDTVHGGFPHDCEDDLNRPVVRHVDLLRIAVEACRAPLLVWAFGRRLVHELRRAVLVLQLIILVAQLRIEGVPVLAGVDADAVEELLRYLCFF